MTRPRTRWPTRLESTAWLVLACFLAQLALPAAAWARVDSLRPSATHARAENRCGPKTRVRGLNFPDALCIGARAQLNPDGTWGIFVSCWQLASGSTFETDSQGRSTLFAYDALGRLTSVTDALGGVTTYAYDELGNRVSQTDANGHTTAFAFDVMGREVSRTLPDGKTATKAYDAAGNLVARTNFLGQTATYSYDTGGRLSERHYPDGSTVGFGYTPSGRRASATDARGTTRYSYDVRGRLETLVNPDGRSLTYSFDANGSRTRLTATVAPGVSYATAYSRDALGRLEVVTADGKEYRHTYDANGNRASLLHPNGIATAYTYDANNRLKSLTSTSSLGVTVQGYAFTLGPTGNRTRIDEVDGTSREYTYDALYRLTGEKVSRAAAPVYENAFAYDAVGNRLSQTKLAAGSSEVLASSFDQRDRLTTDGRATYSFDDEGNLDDKTGPDGANYTWDFDNRLVKAVLANGATVEHTYDADGNRLQTKTTVGGTPKVENYLVDTSGGLSHVVAETDGAGAVTAVYVRGDDLLAIIRPAATRYVHADGLGSIRRLTDNSGTITDSYTYSAFGELLDHLGTDPNPYRFAGEAWDGTTALAYHRARWMDPATGRFVSVDPFEGVEDDPITLHRYLYANADPVWRIDPSGKMTLVEMSINLGITSVLASIALNHDGWVGARSQQNTQRPLTESESAWVQVSIAKIRVVPGFDEYADQLESVLHSGNIVVSRAPPGAAETETRYAHTSHSVLFGPTIRIHSFYFHSGTDATLVHEAAHSLGLLRQLIDLDDPGVMDREPSELGERIWDWVNVASAVERRYSDGRARQLLSPDCDNQCRALLKQRTPSGLGE